MGTIADRIPELEDRYHIMYHAEIANFLGSINEAVIFCYLAFWQGKGKNKETGENTQWVYKSIGDMYYETGLTRSQQKTVIEFLSEKGYLKVESKWVNGYNKVRHFKINWSKFTNDFDGTAKGKFRYRRKQEMLAIKKKKDGII